MGRGEAVVGSRRGRDSNFEVLRIVAMMMVILQHIAVYGGWPIDMGQTFALSPDSFFIQFIYIFGKIGVWIFVLITGYYMVGSDSPVVPKFLKLLLQVFTTSVLIDVLFIVFADVPADSVNWAGDLFPVIHGNWWFASTYLIVLPFTPFVNRLLRALGRREHLTLIVLMLVIWCIIPTVTHSGMYGSFVMMFLLIYTIGAYIRLHPAAFERRAGFYGACALASVLVMALLIALVDLVGPVAGFRPMESTTVWGDERNFMVVAVAVFTFLAFRRLDLGHNRWINPVAATTFGVYLIQEHHFFRGWIFGQLDMGSHFGSPDMVPYVLLCMLGIFAICSVMEFVRMQTVERVTARIVPWLSRIVYRVLDGIVGERDGRPAD